MTQQVETFSDKILAFTLPERGARGRVVRFDDVLAEILSAHKYPAPITHLLAEALVVAALMGALLKGENAQMTMQAQTEDGPVRLLVCDYRNGEMRGYVDFDAGRLSELGTNPTLFALFGKGYLAITFETEQGQRYQGIVPLEGDSLAAACEQYFIQSEQVPTLLRIAVRSGNKGCKAAGLLIQHLPDGEEGRERLHVNLDDPDWEHVEMLAGTISQDELLDEALSLEGIVWRLFHEEDEIRVRHGAIVSKGCRCTAAHYEDVIARFSSEEQDAMRNDAGQIVVDCAFCSKEFALSA